VYETARETARLIRRALQRPDRGALPRALAVLALVGLLAPSLARYAGPEAAGWFVGHGHIYESAQAAAQPHSHPWDTHVHTDSGTTAPDDGASTPGPTPGVLFTLDDLGTLGAFGALALPASLLLAIAWRTQAVEALVAPARGRTLVPLLRPPQR